MNDRRNVVRELLEGAIAEAQRIDQMLCVLFVDLDRFATFNEAFGRSVGDQILATIEARMRRCARHDESIFRVGDEFIIVSPKIANERAAELVASRFLATISELFFIENLPELQCTASVGIAIYPTDAGDATTLVEYAQRAMSGLKESGRNAFARYTEDVIEPSYAFLDLEHRILHGIEHGEFVPHYQPIVDIRSGRLLAMEALTRWAHPELGLLPPARYTVVGETSGLVTRVGQAMLRAACEQGVRWQDITGWRETRIAINLSIQQVTAADFLTSIEECLAQTRLAPGRLQVEMSAAALSDVEDAVARVLRPLARMGVQIAIDHFGSGASSLRQLRKLPIDVLKLDKIFACDISSPKHDIALARAIMTTAHHSRLIVVVEGVDSPAQLEFLRAESCDAIQGALLSRPLAGAEATAFVENFDPTAFATTSV